MFQESTHFKSGWYDFDNGKRYYMRSGFEARWGYYLDFLQKAGEVISWEFEPKHKEFEGVRSGTVFYIPDFEVTYPSEDHPEEIYTFWHETKGQITQKDITKFRRMSRYHPNEKIILVMQKIPKGYSKSAIRQRILVDMARKYVERVIEAEPILKKVGL